MTSIIVRRLKPEDKPEWTRMRKELWPHISPQDIQADWEKYLANPDEEPVFIALRADLSPCGFLEGGTRKYADGCDTSPVGYIEGWYVDEDVRRQGAGGALVHAMEDWTRAKGLAEMASDTWLWNETSIAAHKSLGYLEVERLVHFAKKL